MRNIKIVQNAVLAAAVATMCLGAGTGTARADQITLDVFAPMSAGGDGAACVTGGCALSGTIVINNTTNAFLSADVVMSGESPAVGPFTNPSSFLTSDGPGDTELVAWDAPGNDLFLDFSTPETGSLIGYNGGPLQSAVIETTSTGPYWSNPSPGSLTPVPEASTSAMLAIGFLVFGTFLAAPRFYRCISCRIHSPALA